MSSPRLERRARVLSGVPRNPNPADGWFARLVKSPWTWALIATLLVSFACLYTMYYNEHRDREVPGGTVPGITHEAMLVGLKFAWPTALVLSLVFIWFDRFRKQRIVTWVIAFLWGASVSTFLSYYLNTWMAARLNVWGDGDPSTQARSAIFSAPFTEEATKATILFLIAILARYRVVSVMQTVCLAGLSAVGFAFTENILYYMRIYEEASRTAGAGEPIEYARQLFMLRGVYLCFAHPLFTAFTAIGLAIGLRHRSKLVRILAPLAGFALAACGHMTFNGISSTVGEPQVMRYYYVSLALVAVLIGVMITWMLREGGRIRVRLTDFVRYGWLTPEDPVVYSSLWRRLRVLIIAISQPRRLRATILMMRQMTELAYLQDAMVRGLIDAVGYDRSKEILISTRALRAAAVTSPKGEKIHWPNVAAWFRRRSAQVGTGFGAPAPQFAPPSGAPAASFAPPRR